MCEKMESEIQRLREQVKLYRFDYVTGLKQRQDFERDARQHFNEGGFYLAMHDIDGLKKLNDTHGHPAGDSLIRQVANDLRMCETLCTAYRVGGDEFMTIHCPLTKVEEADVYVANTSYAVVFTGNYESLDDAVNAVDKLMYKKKRDLKRRESDS